MRTSLGIAVVFGSLATMTMPAEAAEYQVTETDEEIRIITPQLEAAIRKTGYDSEAMFLRIDMPGHIKHENGDTFSRIYLSYHGQIPASQFTENFPPDIKFNYRRDSGRVPDRFIRAYRLRTPGSDGDGPWLAGMTLDPTVVHEAWCHQRGYVCMIEEVGGRPIKKGQSFGAAYLVGYFDSISEMQRTYDLYKGHTRLEADTKGWRLAR